MKAKKQIKKLPAWCQKEVKRQVSNPQQTEQVSADLVQALADGLQSAYMLLTAQSTNFPADVLQLKQSMALYSKRCQDVQRGIEALQVCRVGGLIQ